MSLANRRSILHLSCAFLAALLVTHCWAEEKGDKKCPLACEISLDEKTYATGGTLTLKMAITVTAADSNIYNAFFDRRLPHLPHVYLRGPKGPNVRPDRDLASVSLGTFKSPSPKDWQQRRGHDDFLGTTIELRLPEELPPGNYTIVVVHSSAVVSSPPGASTSDPGWRERVTLWEKEKFTENFLVSNVVELEIVGLEK